jgi:hypothetical protein
MAEQNHVVRQLTVSAAFADEHGARTMRARIEGFWREIAPPVMARLFDEMVPADRHVRLQRLDLDLGNLPAQGFEAAAEAALTRVLREMLLRAVAEGGGTRSLSGDEASLELLEHYLSRGIVPFWSRMVALELPALVATLSTRQPTLLAALLRRIARDRAALERLVLHLREEDLRALIAILSPVDAALIVAYLAQIIAVHRIEPLVPVEEPALRREMWILTLEYLLRDAGTQFNRRSFLAALLGGLAEREDVEYTELLLLLRDTLDALERRTPLQSSLPAALRELLAETGLPAESGQQTGGAAARAATDDARAFEVLMDAVRAWHRKEGGLPLSDAELRRHLESAAHEAMMRPLALQDRLVSMLRSFAAREGIAENELLSALSEQAPTLAAFVKDERHTEAEAQVAAGFLGELEDALRRGDRERLVRLIELLAEESPAALAAFMRQLAREFGTLFRAVALLTEASLTRLLQVLDDAHAEEVSSYLETLRIAHRAEPLISVGEERFAQITWTLALDYAAREPGSQFNRRSLLRNLIAGIARHDGIEELVVMQALMRGLEALAARRTPTGSMPAILAELIVEVAAQPRHAQRPRWAPDSLQQAAFFLRTGRPEDTGAGLARLAVRDAPGFAALLRALAEEDAAAWPARLERLLQWLAPQEIAALFGSDSIAVARAAEAVSWQAALSALVRGDVLPSAQTAPPQPMDLEAMLTFWLEFDALPSWAPQDLTPNDLAQMLATANLTLLRTIFSAAGEAERAIMLQRARRHLGDARMQTMSAVLALPQVEAKPAEPMPAISIPPAPVDRALLLAWLNGERDLAPGQAEQIAALFAQLAARNDTELLAILRSAARDTTRRRRWLAVLPGHALAKLIDLPPADRVLLLAWLKGEAEAPSAEAMAARFVALADAEDSEFRDIVIAAWRDPAARRRWLAVLSPRALARLLYLVAPAQAHFLLESAQMLTTAWRQIAPHASRELPWGRMFDLLANEPGHGDARRLSQGLVTALAGSDPATRIRLLTRAHALAREAGAVQLTAVFQPPRPKRITAPGVSKRPDARADTADEPIYVRNAGLVLFAPFLPRLFERLDVLRDGPDGKPRVSGVEAATRVVHLLQYLVDERLDTPEPELALNKLIAGLDLALPIAPSYEATAEERELCDSLVAAVIANWPIIKNTSPAGLRETFVQREGKITRSGDTWQLRVQRKTVDVLVDQVPWSFAVILQRWMEHSIHVTW